MVAHICHPSTWGLRQEGAYEFKATTLGYTARGQIRKHTKILSENEFMRSIEEVGSIPYCFTLHEITIKRDRGGASLLQLSSHLPYRGCAEPTAQKAALSSQTDQMKSLTPLPVGPASTNYMGRCGNTGRPTHCTRCPNAATAPRGQQATPLGFWSPLKASRISIRSFYHGQQGKIS